ncbi:MAG: hypothetical protein D6682_06305, partial [Zetaproteobacteria bacterium]
MGQDFARLSSEAMAEVAPPRPKRDGRASRLGRALLVAALVAVVAAAFAGGHYLGRMEGIDQQKASARQQLQRQLEAQRREIDRLKRELAARPKKKATARPDAVTEVGELTFYDDLIHDKVDPTVATAETGQGIERGVADIIAQSSLPEGGRLPLYIQLGSFGDRTSAELLKQQVVRLGMIAFIRPVTLSGG